MLRLDESREVSDELDLQDVILPQLRGYAPLFLNSPIMFNGVNARGQTFATRQAIFSVVIT